MAGPGAVGDRATRHNEKQNGNAVAGATLRMGRKSASVVDDEFLISELLSAMLADPGIEVGGKTATANEALAIAAACAPEFMLMDVRLRGKRDGVEAANDIRNVVETRIIPITGSAEPATLGRIGEVPVLMKPIRADQLRSAVLLAMGSPGPRGMYDLACQNRRLVIRTNHEFKGTCSMSDNPLDALAEHDRVSIRAVLVREGEDGSAALAEAGFLDSVAIPVIEGEDEAVEGGILGDGITPNLVAVLETEQTDDFDASGGAEPDAAGAEADVSAPSRPETTMVPAAFGMQPLAPVRRVAHA